MNYIAKISGDLPELLDKVASANRLVIDLNQARMELEAERDRLSAELVSRRADKSGHQEGTHREASTNPAQAESQDKHEISARQGGLSSVMRSFASWFGRQPSFKVLGRIDDVNGRPWVEGRQVRVDQGIGLLVRGWAFAERHSAIYPPTAAWLIQGDKSIEGKMDPERRLDLVDHFSRQDLDRAGFVAQFSCREMSGSFEFVIEFRSGNVSHRARFGLLTVQF